uniref:Uncharacterized protein n=1 Tax=Cacopsylla melanoneura TaxID=428564 RepID=A0A8D8Q2N6_9HEMI
MVVCKKCGRLNDLSIVPKNTLERVMNARTHATPGFKGVFSVPCIQCRQSIYLDSTAKYIKKPCHKKPEEEISRMNVQYLTAKNNKKACPKKPDESSKMNVQCRQSLNLDSTAKNNKKSMPP